VSQIARFQDAPSTSHWHLGKHILRYLKGTRDLVVTYSGNSAHQNLRGFVDASWGEDPSTRRSQSGYAFLLADAAISWRTKLQSTVALSSTEAEYLALSDAIKEALFLRNILTDLWPACLASVTLFEDNQGTIKQALNLQSSARTKHIDVRHHFCKQHVACGDVSLSYVPTAEQPADCLTKGLDKVKVSLFRQILLGSG
jgi:hypothetical protein